MVRGTVNVCILPKRPFLPPAPNPVSKRKLDHAKSCESETKTLEIFTAATVLFFCPFHLFCQQLFLWEKETQVHLPYYINIIVAQELHKRSTVQLQCRISSSPFFVRRVWSNSKLKKTRGFLGRDKELRYFID